MTTFALIPGAGGRPGVYRWTIAELERLGHEAIAPAVPTDDPVARPSDHADAVVKAVAGHEDVVVVGQSLGAYAAVIVADRIPVSAVVLLAPMIPQPRESAGEWWGDDEGHADAIAATLARLGPMGSWGPDALEEVFLHDVPEKIRLEAARYDGAPGPGMFAEPLPVDEWPDVPTHVLAPREDRLFPLGFQRRVARERLGLEVDEMDGGHVAMLARPRELAERLVALTS